MFHFWAQWLSKSKSPKSGRKERKYGLHVEQLERRVVPASVGGGGGGNPNQTFTVNSIADDPAGPTTGIVTLRDAINAVNSDANDNAASPDVINFAIAGTPTSTLTADLPTLVNPVEFDGSTQQGGTVVVNGNSHAVLIAHATAILNAVNFTGSATVGANSQLTLHAGSTLNVSGALAVGNAATIDNSGILAVSGNFNGGSNVNVNNNDGSSLTVGGSFTTGGAMTNSGACAMTVTGDCTVGGQLFNGAAVTDNARLTVGGTFSASGDVYNFGASSIHVTGDFLIVGNFTNERRGGGGGEGPVPSTTLTVGGNFSGGGSVVNNGTSVITIDGNFSLTNPGQAVGTNASSIFVVRGDFTLNGPGGSVYDGQSSSDAPVFLVGGNFTLGTASNVNTLGSNALTVIGNFTLGANSYFDDLGGLAVGGSFDPGPGGTGLVNTIGGTLTALPGSSLTTDTTTWEVLGGGLLEVEARASLTLAAGGTLQIDAGGTFAVDSGGTFTQAGGVLVYSDAQAVTWTWTGAGGDGNWDTATNWSAVLSPHWAGGSPNAYPGQGMVAGENDTLTINTGATASTITVRAPDNLSVEALSTGVNDTLVIGGGTLTVSNNSSLLGPLSMTGGTLAVEGTGTTLKVTGATTVTGASLSASAAAILSLPKLKSYANGSANNPTTFTADGVGSLLNLPALVTLGSLASQWTISAQNGGEINLAALTIPNGTSNVAENIGAGSTFDSATTVTVGTGSSTTVSGGTFTTTNYQLAPNAHLIVTAGTFGGSFDLAAGATMTIYGGTFAGTTFNLAAGASVTIDAGTFTGTTTWNASQGATVSVDNVPTASGTWTGTGLGTVRLNSGRLFIGTGGLTLNFAGTMFQWTGGQMDAGQGNLTNLGTMNVSGATEKDFYNDGVLDNFGTIIQTGIGNLQLGTDGTFPATFKNEASGSYLLEGDGSFTEISDSGFATGQTSLINSGIIRKTTGTGTSNISVLGSITNTGTIEADAGTIALHPTGGIKQIVGGTLTGGTWIATGGATLNLGNGVAITTNQGNLTLSGANSSIGGSAGLASTSGSFTVTNGASFTTTGDFANAGTLTIGPASTLHVSGNFTESGTLNEQIGGTPTSGQFGKIAVTQTANLGGPFNLGLVNGFGPSAAQDFPVLTYKHVSGGFSTFTGLGSFFSQSQGVSNFDLIDNATNTVDLQLSSVNAPTAATSGQLFAINWTISNPGSQAATGSWQDSVYLSATPTITGNSILLGAVTHTGGLGTGASSNGSLSVAVPAVPPGFYYVLVQADSLYQVADPNRANNTASATTGQVDLSVPTLTLGTPLSGSFTASEQENYYQITVSAGGTLQLTLTNTGGSGATALYVSRGVLPTPYSFQESAQLTNQVNQTVIVPQTVGGGTYYVLAYDIYNFTSSINYTLTATQASNVTVTALSTYAATNGGNVTIEVDGTNFAPNATVSLTLNSTTIDASAIDFVNASQLFATFNLTSAQPGSYTLTVQSANAQRLFVVVPRPVLVGSPGVPNTPPAQPFRAVLVTPEFIRSGRTGTIVINYTNQTEHDVAAPLLEISSTNAKVFFSTPDDPNHFVQSAQVLAVAPNGPAGILRPGQRGQLTLTLLSKDTISGDTIPVQVSQLAVGQTIPWAAQQAATQPPNVPTAAWNVIYANLLGTIGATTDSYNAALAQAATYLSGLGETTAQVSDVGVLWSFLVSQAGATIPSKTLVSAVDAPLLVPGKLSLAIDRIFVASLASRYTPSIFGLGWTTSWQTSLSVDSSGNVTINNGGNLSAFPIQPNATYLSTAGEHGALTLAGGVYTFTSGVGVQNVFLPNGLLNYEQDTNGNRITLGYNSDNQLITLTYSNPTDPSEPTAQLTLAYYTTGANTGLVQSVTDGTGNTWSYHYDGASHLTAAIGPGTGPSGNPGTLTTTYTYDTGSNPETANALLSITNPDGSQQNFSYDPTTGRLAGSSRNAGADPVTYSYLAEAEVLATDANNDQTTVWYNELGLPARVQDPRGGLATYAYDNNGNLASTTDAAGDTYQYTYSASGNLTQTVNPLGQQGQMTYNALSALTSITDANNNTTQYSYNSAGSLLNIAYPDGTQQSFTYDPLGNLSETIRQNGDAIGYQYNALGRPTQENFADGTQETFSYDAHGNPLTAQAFDTTGKPTGTPTTLTYNAVNELTSISYPDGLSLTFTYNAQGQRIQSVDQSGYTINYRFDSQGRLAELTDGSTPPKPIVQYSYNAVGQLQEKLNGNGTSTTYTYDPNGNLTGETNYAGGTTVHSSFLYTYNALNEMTSMTEGGSVTRYGYDAIGQLTQVTLPSGTSITYVYNAAGDRTEVLNNSTPTSYASNADNEITQVGSAGYTYDANGNLASVTDASGTSTYAFSDLNQLLSITTADGTVTTFQYNPLGFLVGESVNGTQTSYLIDPAGSANVVASYHGGALTAHYNYGLGLVSQTGPSGTGYYDFDVTGNTVGITGASGTYVNQYSYLPFGETTTIAAALPNPFTFVGKFGVLQIGTNLFHMHARDYTPATGQFLSDDPIGLQGADLNPRRYTSNNPFFVDPQGTIGEDPNSIYWAALIGELARKAGADLTNPAEFRALASSLGVDIGASATAAEGGGFLLGASGTVAAGAVVTAAGVGVGIGTLINNNVLSQGQRDAIGQTLYNGVQALTGQKQTDFSNPYGDIPAAPLSTKNIPSVLGLTSPSPTIATTTNVTSEDPNALIGPAGVGAQHFLPDSGTLPYTIDFENDGSAAALAVTVKEQFDSNLDWTTFQLGSFGFGPVNSTVPAGLTTYQTTVNYKNSDGTPLNVKVSLDFNVGTGLLTVTFASLDPLTGVAPSGVFDGFLYPENGTGVGQGYVAYTIQPKAGLATPKTIAQQASVVFDTNKPLLTGLAVNSIDSGAPTSSVSPLPATEPTGTFTVNWAGQDDAGGSGIASYTVYVSDNGGVFTPFVTATTATSATFTGVTGHTYSFYSIAIDEVGNIQATPAAVQATTTIGSGGPVITPVAAQTVAEGATLTVTVSATVPGASGGGLTYQLGAGAPTGAAINATSGSFTWTPSPWNGQPPGIYTIPIIVAETAAPQRTASTTFTVTVGPSSTAQGSGAAARQAVAAGLLQSLEAYTDFVTGLYGQYMNRPPLAGEANYWVTLLQRAWSQEQVEAGFLDSTEYLTAHGGVGNSWVQSLYTTLFGRTANATEMRYWSDHRSNGLTAAEIALAFTTSQEHESEVLAALYHGDLGRAGSAAEIQSWANLYFSGLSNEQIAAAFLRSTEYYQDHSGDVVDWMFAAYHSVLGRLPDLAGYNYWEAQLA